MNESGTLSSVTYGFFHLQTWGIDKTNKQTNKTKDSLYNTEHAYYPRLDYSQQQESHGVLAYICSPICRERIYFHMHNIFLEGIKGSPKRAICRATYIHNSTSEHIVFKGTSKLISFLHFCPQGVHSWRNNWNIKAQQCSSQKKGTSFRYGRGQGWLLRENKHELSLDSREDN